MISLDSSGVLNLADDRVLGRDRPRSFRPVSQYIDGWDHLATELRIWGKEVQVKLTITDLIWVNKSSP